MLTCDILRYTAPRIKQTWTYCQKRLERDPSPRTYIALCMVQRSCTHVLAFGLDTEGQVIDVDGQQQLLSLEREWGTESWITRILPTKVHDLMQALVAFSWHQVLALIGDWVARPGTELRVKAQSLQVHNNHLLLGKEWTVLYPEIMGQKKVYDKYGFERPDEIKT